MYLYYDQFRRDSIIQKAKKNEDPRDYRIVIVLKIKEIYISEKNEESY